VFNTSIQVGASIGIAVIGVIFFGLLGTQSGPAAVSVTPQLRGALTAAGLPRAATAPVVAAFRGCLHNRLVATDPTATPASCRLRGSPGGRSHGQHSGVAGALPASARHALAAIGKQATGIDFAAALQWTLLFQVGVFVVSFLLMLALPRAMRARPAPAAASGRLVAQPVLVRDTGQD
jgi:hypothetical protein